MLVLFSALISIQFNIIKNIVLKEANTGFSMRFWSVGLVQSLRHPHLKTVDPGECWSVWNTYYSKNAKSCAEISVLSHRRLFSVVEQTNRFWIKVSNKWCILLWVVNHWQHGGGIEQRIFLNQILGQATPKRIHFYYLKNSQDQSIQKNIQFLF